MGFEILVHLFKIPYSIWNNISGTTVMISEKAVNIKNLEEEKHVLIIVSGYISCFYQSGTA